MFNDVRKNENKGFSLVELIVVIAIMAVLTAVLAPALLQYVERSRAQKDDSAMGEVTNAVKIAMADQDVYDELLMYNIPAAHAHYAHNVPADVEGYAALVDETPSPFATTQRGVTITFIPDANAKSSVVTIGEGVINQDDADDAAGDAILSEATLAESGDATAYMFKTLKNIVGEKIKLVSQTYRASQYTVFIKMGTLGGADSAIAVYGEWQGTNLG